MHILGHVYIFTPNIKFLSSNHVAKRTVHKQWHQHWQTKHDCIGSLVDKPNEPKSQGNDPIKSQDQSETFQSSTWSSIIPFFLNIFFLIWQYLSNLINANLVNICLIWQYMSNLKKCAFFNTLTGCQLYLVKK